MGTDLFSENISLLFSVLPSTTIRCQAVIDYVVAGAESKTKTVDFICYAATLIGKKNIK